VLCNFPPANPSESLAHYSLSYTTVKVILLLGGGFAMADGIRAAGLSAVVGEQFERLDGLSSFALCMISVSLVAFLTQVTSNTATSLIILPLVASLASALRAHPLPMMMAVVNACNLAFLFPTSTAVVAMVFTAAKGQLKFSSFFKPGLLTVLAGVLIMPGVAYSIMPFVFYRQATWPVPEWVYNHTRP
jgi:solute carrier family 13 (sodium-dependent dicarboxylate transporter), member 2/3/5